MENLQHEDVVDFIRDATGYSTDEHDDNAPIGSPMDGTARGGDRENNALLGRPLCAAGAHGLATQRRIAFAPDGGAKHNTVSWAIADSTGRTISDALGPEDVFAFNGKVAALTKFAFALDGSGAQDLHDTGGPMATGPSAGGALRLVARLRCRSPILAPQGRDLGLGVGACTLAASQACVSDDMAHGAVETPQRRN
jgi:hypothetical protein